MASDEHGDFKVRLEMEENGENLDFLQEIDEDFFIDEMVDPFSTINDAGASENSEKLIAEMKRTLENANSENTSMKRFKTVSEDEIKKFRDSRQTESTNATQNGVLKSYKNGAQKRLALKSILSPLKQPISTPNYPNFMLKPDQKLHQKILSLNITKIP